LKTSRVPLVQQNAAVDYVTGIRHDRPPLSFQFKVKDTFAVWVSPAAVAVTVTLKVPVPDKPERYPAPHPLSVNRRARVQTAKRVVVNLRCLRSGMSKAKATRETSDVDIGRLRLVWLFAVSPVSRTNVRVSVDGAVPENVTLAGEKRHAVYAGSPEQEKVTGWVKMPSGVNVSCTVGAPASTLPDTLAGEAVIVKLGGGVTVTFCTAEVAELCTLSPE